VTKEIQRVGKSKRERVENIGKKRTETKALIKRKDVNPQILFFSASHRAYPMNSSVWSNPVSRITLNAERSCKCGGGYEEE